MSFEQLIYEAQLKITSLLAEIIVSNKMDEAYPRIIPVKCQISGIKCPNSTIRIIRAKISRNTG